MDNLITDFETAYFLFELIYFLKFTDCLNVTIFLQFALLIRPKKERDRLVE